MRKDRAGERGRGKISLSPEQPELTQNNPEQPKIAKTFQNNLMLLFTFCFVFACDLLTVFSDFA